MPIENTDINNGKDKSYLRRRKLMLRRSLGETELINISENVIKHIRNLQAYKNADVVYFYMAAGNEVNVASLFEECLRMGKKCIFPRVINDSRMEFFVVCALDELKEGYKGIREPDLNCSLYNKYDRESSIMLVPGAVFDRQGGRIGMGKGFYDRYIYSNRPDCLLGVCGEYQLEDKVPMDKNDIFMDMVVTEKGVYNGRL